MIDWIRTQVAPRRNAPSRAQVLATRPLRNPAIVWTREEREPGKAPLALLKVPRRADRVGNLVARWFRLPDHKKIELDAIGSDVWEMCDGRTSVEAIARAICTSYRLNRRQGETSVTAYLRMLAQRRLIGLRGGDGAKAARKKEQRKR